VETISQELSGNQERKENGDLGRTFLYGRYWEKIPKTQKSRKKRSLFGKLGISLVCRKDKKFYTNGEKGKKHWKEGLLNLLQMTLSMKQ